MKYCTAQDAWNLRGTFSLSVGVMAAAIVPLFAIFVRYSDKLAYRYEQTPWCTLGTQLPLPSYS